MAKTMSNDERVGILVRMCRPFYTLKTIGEQIKLSRERVRQLSATGKEVAGANNTDGIPHKKNNTFFESEVR